MTLGLFPVRADRIGCMKASNKRKMRWLSVGVWVVSIIGLTFNLAMHTELRLISTAIFNLASLILPLVWLVTNIIPTDWLPNS